MKLMNILIEGQESYIEHLKNKPSSSFAEYLKKQNKLYKEKNYLKRLIRHYVQDS